MNLPDSPTARPAGNRQGPDLWKHARTVISGGTGLLSKRAEMFDAEIWPAYFSRCDGCQVWDLEGNAYIDFAGGIGAVLLGYNDPDVTAAVQERLTLGTYCSLVNPQEVALADKLLALHPWAGKVRYARGGGEVMSMAIRIARAATGRSGIAFCGYHGWHDWYLAANLGEDDALDGHLLAGLPPKGVPKELKGTSVAFRYNDFSTFEQALSSLGNNLAAVVMEPMRSQFPEDDFVAKVAARCREAGGVFIIDEISSGWRYGFPGALSSMGIEPDLVTYAKALSNGFPFATVIGRTAIMDAADDSFISSSYWTDGIGPAAAWATLEKLEKHRVTEVVRQRGSDFKTALSEVAAKYPLCNLTVGGMPSTPSLTFGLGALSLPTKTYYIRKMLDEGFLASTYFYLMYAHEKVHFDKFLQSFDNVLGQLNQQLEEGNLLEHASAQGNINGFTRLA